MVTIERLRLHTFDSVWIPPFAIMEFRLYGYRETEG